MTTRGTFGVIRTREPSECTGANCHVKRLAYQNANFLTGMRF
jgi:hypothetical protein